MVNVKVLNFVFKKLVLINLSLAVAFGPCTSFGQGAGAGPAISPGAVPGEKSELSGTRKQLATIIFAGLAGAILGLSTMSFYGRPQEHLSNIAIGFAVGVIGGTIVTTYQAATKPYDVYDITSEGRFETDREKKHLLTMNFEF
jgi:hypothetical protein